MSSIPELVEKAKNAYKERQKAQKAFVEADIEARKAPHMGQTDVYGAALVADRLANGKMCNAFNALTEAICSEAWKEIEEEKDGKEED